MFGSREKPESSPHLAKAMDHALHSEIRLELNKALKKSLTETKNYTGHMNHSLFGISVSNIIWSEKSCVIRPALRLQFQVLSGNAHGPALLFGTKPLKTSYSRLWSLTVHKRMPLRLLIGVWQFTAMLRFCVSLAMKRVTQQMTPSNIIPPLAQPSHTCKSQKEY